MTRDLLVVFFLIIVGTDSEVTQLVQILVVGHNTDPIAKRVLLEVLLGQILQIPLREVNVRVDINLHLLALERHIVSQVASFSSNFEVLAQEFFLK